MYVYRVGSFTESVMGYWMLYWGMTTDWMRDWGRNAGRIIHRAVAIHPTSWGKRKNPASSTPSHTTYHMGTTLWRHLPASNKSYTYLYWNTFTTPLFTETGKQHKLYLPLAIVTPLHPTWSGPFGDISRPAANIYRKAAHHISLSIGPPHTATSSIRCTTPIIYLSRPTPA